MYMFMFTFWKVTWIKSSTWQYFWITFSPFHWRKYFSKNGDDNNYAILSDNGEYINSGQTVGLFRLVSYVLQKM